MKTLLNMKVLESCPPLPREGRENYRLLREMGEAARVDPLLLIWDGVGIMARMCRDGCFRDVLYPFTIEPECQRALHALARRWRLHGFSLPEECGGGYVRLTKEVRP